METETATPANQRAALRPYAEPTRAETDRGILLQRVMNLYPGFIPQILAAFDAVEDLRDSEAPAEKCLSDVIGDYSCGRLTPAEAQANVDLYEANVQNLAEETRTELADDSPAARSLEQTKLGGLKFKAPKNRKGRQLSLPPVMVDALRIHKFTQGERRNLMGV